MNYSLVFLFAGVVVMCFLSNVLFMSCLSVCDHLVISKASYKFRCLLIEHF